MSADERKPSRGLGRGLSALLGEGEEADAIRADTANAKRSSSSRDGVQILPVELVQPNPDQPRKTFTEADLGELTESIATKGLLQPILVRPMSGETERYQIVAGERRWRAAQRAQLHEVPCLVRELTDRETLEIQGVVLTMYDRRNNLSSQVAADVREHFGDKVYKTVIPRNVRVSEAPSFGKPVLLYDLECAGAQAYLKLASEVVKQERRAADALTPA